MLRHALHVLILGGLVFNPGILLAQDAPVTFNDARQSLDKGEYPLAESQFRALAAANPSSAEALDDLAITLQLEGKEQEAMIVFERVLKIRRLPDAVAMLAVDFCSNHQFDQALPLLNEAKANLHDPNQMATLGPCFLEADQPENAIPIYTALVKNQVKPVDENTANLIRSYFDLSRKLLEALPEMHGGLPFARTVDAARKDSSSDVEAAFPAAYSQAEYLKPDMSVDDLIALLPLHPKDPALFYVLGVKAAEQADTLFQQLQQDSPDGIAIEQLTAELKDSSGDRDGAIRVYEQILAHHPDAPASVHFALGLLYAERHRWQDALTQYRIAAPDGQGSLYITERTSECLLHLGDIRADEDLLRNVVQNTDAPFWALRDFGEAAEQQGDATTALKYLQRASTQKPDDASIHYRLFQLYKKLNQKEAAEHEFALFRQLWTVQ